MGDGAASAFKIKVRPQVGKTQLLYEGEEENLNNVRDVLAGYKSSEPYPAFEGKYTSALFFYHTDEKFIGKLEKAANRFLAAPAKKSKRAGASRSARSPLYVKAFVVLLILALGSGFYYHLVLMSDPQQWDPEVGEFREELLARADETEDIEEPDEEITRKQAEPEITEKTPVREKPEPDLKPEQDIREYDDGRAVVITRTGSGRSRSRGGVFPRSLEVHFIDVGQGDAILIRTPDRRHILIDAGRRRRTVADYLDNVGVRRLDLVIMTHPHADHIGGITEVLENFNVKEVWDAGIAHTTRTYENVLHSIDRKNISYDIPESGDSQRWGSYCRAQVLNPKPDVYHSDLNNASIAVLMRCAQNSFLFTGDAEKRAEADMVRNHNLPRVDVYKVGHHGSRTSSTMELLNRIRPKYAVISCGAGNSYGHPSPVALRNLKRIGAEIYRTDRQGTIIARGDGRTIRMIPEERRARLNRDNFNSMIAKRAPAELTYSVGLANISSAQILEIDNIKQLITVN